MADAEPGKYRPRRAIVEPDPEPIPAKDDLADEDAPKPLYRDEVAGGSSALPPAGAAEKADASEKGDKAGAARPITFTPRRTRSADEDATTLLPRTPSGRRTDDVDGFEDLGDDERRPLGQRTKLALLIAAVAAVVVVGLAIGYAVLGVGKTPTTSTTPGPSVGASTDPSATAAPSVNLLGDETLLSVADAGLIAKKTWKVASTQRGATPDAALPACFGPDPVEGQPTPQQQVLRLLSSTGKKAPGILHQATAYASPEDAAQAYAVAAKTLGTCAVTGSYLFSGQFITGVGDQAIGVIVTSISGDTTSQHTVVLSRTGQVMNIVDATQPDDKLTPLSVAKATAALVGRECIAAGGPCAGGTVSVQDAAPPVGGDEPGFLATGDLPPAGKSPMPWVATPPELPKDDFLGSQCETVNWSTLSTVATTSRVYIVQDSGSFFGLNDIVVTLKDSDTATKLVEKIKSDLESCEKRKLTAKVDDPDKVSGPGAKKTTVSGYTAEVTQRSTEGTKKYRVGVVAAGSKVAYTFLNPQDGLDFTDAQWDTVAVRAGQRASQVN